ncbi:Uncharacterised protein [Streptococcus suis]|nr:Uncharacterised protein [Streptococcus suis]
MNYYHIKLMGDVQQLERPSKSFTQENNWMYFSTICQVHQGI